MPQAAQGQPGESGRPDKEKRPTPKPGIKLRVVDRERRWGGVRIRIKKPRSLRGSIRLRIAKPVLPIPLLPEWARRAEVALLMAPAELSLAVSRRRGSPNAERRFSARLPPPSIRSSLRAGNVQEPDVVVFTLKRMWHETGLGKRDAQAVTLIIPDQCVRMVTLPFENRPPRHADGNAMARWALRKALPGDIDAYSIDWSIMSGENPDQEGGWLFALAAETALVREYERPVERLGLSVGRVFPATLAVAAGTHRGRLGDSAVDGAARIVLCGTGRRPAALVEADGIPRIHRAWRHGTVDMDAELRSIDTYARDRQGLNIVQAVVAGPPRWSERVAGICKAMGWSTTLTSRWGAHRGATRR